MTNEREQFRQEVIEELRPLLSKQSEEKEEKPVEEISDEEKPATEEQAPEEEKELESSEESLLELERQLSGHTKEFKDLVKSIADPELQKKAIEAGKVSRAREDRLATDLGEAKKQYENVANFRQMLEMSPQNTILQIAKMANIDLKSLVEPTAEEESAYEPEDRNTKIIKNIEQQNKLLAQKLEALEQERLRQVQEAIDQEIDAMVANTDKYPHFIEMQESIADLLAIELKKNGMPKNSQERISRLEKAYQRALLLDEKLLEKRDQDLMLKLEAKRKADVEKAKMQKKVANTYAKNPITPASIKEDLIAEFKKMGL